jgi:hypothetical protein
MEEFLNALDDLIAETEGLSVIELVGALELAKNDIIAGLAVAELLTEEGEVKRQQHDPAHRHRCGPFTAAKTRRTAKASADSSR